MSSKCVKIFLTCPKIKQKDRKTSKLNSVNIDISTLQSTQKNIKTTSSINNASPSE